MHVPQILQLLSFRIPPALRVPNCESAQVFVKFGAELADGRWTGKSPTQCLPAFMGSSHKWLRQAGEKTKRSVGQKGTAPMKDRE
jgi:hypothetical protein